MIQAFARKLHYIADYSGTMIQLVKQIALCIETCNFSYGLNQAFSHTLLCHKLKMVNVYSYSRFKELSSSPYPTFRRVIVQEIRVGKWSGPTIDVQTTFNSVLNSRLTSRQALFVKPSHIIKEANWAPLKHINHNNLMRAGPFSRRRLKNGLGINRKLVDKYWE